MSNGRAHSTLTVPAAELWWTHDLGDPVLYDATITLLAGGKTLDRVTDRVGLRTIALDRGADPEGGHVFRFILNGAPVFARGAAWLPADMLVGSVEADRIRSLVGLARDSSNNLNTTATQPKTQHSPSTASPSTGMRRQRRPRSPISTKTPSPMADLSASSNMTGTPPRRRCMG